MQDQNNSSDVSASDIVEKDILELIGGENLSQEQKEELYQTMLETIQSRVILRIDDALNDEDFDQWAKLIKQGDSEKTSTFLQSKNIDVPKLMVEESVKYKTEVVSYANYVKQTGKKTEDVLNFLKNASTN